MTEHQKHDREPHIDLSLAPEDILTPSTHAELNQRFGLPSYSAVLDGVVAKYGEESVAKTMLSLEQNAHVVFLSNAFYNNIDLVFENYQKVIEIQNCLGVILSGKEGQEVDEWETAELLMEAIHVVSALFVLTKAGPQSEVLDRVLGFFKSVIEGANIRNQAVKLGHLQTKLEAIAECRTPKDYEEVLSLISEGVLTKEVLVERASLSPHLYQTIGLKVLDACTVQCSFCSEECSPHIEQGQSIKIADLDKLDAVFQGTHTVAISGGEPLEHPEIVEITEKLIERGHHVTFVTTGGDIETLERLLPSLKRLSEYSVNLSLHHECGRKGRRNMATAIAFFLKHNITFAINYFDTVKETIFEHQALIIEIMSELEGMELRHGLDVEEGVNGAAVFMQRTRQIPTPNNTSLKFATAPILPAGKAEMDVEAQQAVGATLSFVHRQGRKSSSLCSFPLPDIRPDGTVSGCSSVVGATKVKRAMDHWPESVGELQAAMAEYHKNLRVILGLADGAREHPCVIHRRFGGKA